MPLGLAAIAVQSSLYDVPGGFRAVMFDRFTGVKATVSDIAYPASTRRHSLPRSVASACNPDGCAHQAEGALFLTEHFDDHRI